jgi:hypothetical protein
MDKLPKKESARLQEERTKLDLVLGGIRTMNGLPSTIFIIDCKKEHIAIKEAHRLEIPIVAVVDTNCDPDEVDYVIPGNDDAIRAVKLMASQMAEAINEGRGMAQSAMEQRADAAMSGQVGGAVHIGEGGRIEYVGAPQMELPPVSTGDDDEEMPADFDAAQAEALSGDASPAVAAAVEAEAAAPAAVEAGAVEAGDGNAVETQDQAAGNGAENVLETSGTLGE